MSYEDDALLYHTVGFRDRAGMCAREQGYTYASDADAGVAALGQGVVAGVEEDIDALIAAVVTAPGSGDVAGDDQALLSAMQAVWPTVAAARYPDAV